MKLIRMVSILLGVLVFVFLSAAAQENPKATRNIHSESQFVVIDQSEPAFIVFTGIPKNISEEELEAIKTRVSNREKLTMLTWEKFVESVDEYARTVTLTNDYPNIKTVDGLVCLLASEQGAGAPWGLTWNSGIALTANDYQYARRTYEIYKANPASYRRTKDPKGDPLNPRGFLAFGGCSTH